VAALWDGRRVPVTLLGGYLGSGKTTLLNELLATADRRYAVLVNDVGAVNVDAALVASRDGDTIELTDGCICCSLVDGFALAFERIRERPEPPDHVLVEMSGVADPARVVPWTGTAGFRLDGVLVAFDVDQGLEMERARWSGDTLRRQVAAADLLVLTKRDLADADAECAARERLAALAPGTPVLAADRGRLPAGWLGAAPGAGGRKGPPAAGEPDGGHHVVGIEVPDAAEREDLERWLDALPAHVVRVKGLVSTRTGPVLVEAVGHRRRVRDVARELAQFELAESEKVGTLVVIATAQLDPKALARGLKRGSG